VRFNRTLAGSLELTRQRVERFVSRTVRPSLCDSEVRIVEQAETPAIRPG